ncbi:hypothetical protein BgAZ_301830 [Babesia gibsoni]|uniref:Uncharacterized protein n=1 Tax=Babesia gibsoni TaxID=33632 RepID=A0AAD8P8N6_BABGI|nr:hypothetical protein BgAZ_301830 [Babesia gibsoni]
MDHNCVNNGIFFPAGSRWHCKVNCTALSRCGSFLAAGTVQGSVVLWRLTRRKPTTSHSPVYSRRLKTRFQGDSDVTLDPYFMLLSSNNPIANPVIHVAFASGFKPVCALKGDLSERASSFRGDNNAEEVLVALHKDNSLVVWSLRDCRCLHKVKGPPFAIKQLCVLPDDRFVALVGVRKINIIDMWRLKLIGMLELNGTCHFEKNIYSTFNYSFTQLGSGEDLSLDSNNTDTFCATPTSQSNVKVYKNPKRILKVACSTAPLEGPHEGNDEHREKCKEKASEINTESQPGRRCPMLLAALLDNNEMVLWDLTGPILAYKRKYGASNGPLTVTTHWDRYCHGESIYHKQAMLDFSASYEGNVKRVSTIALLMGSGEEEVKETVEKEINLPMVREWMPELQATGGDVCIMDSYVFLIFGARIAVWFYDSQGVLNRIAELLSVDGREILEHDPWNGIQCIRLEGTPAFLIAWTLSGRVSVFTVPDFSESIQHFKLVNVRLFPKMNSKMCFKRHILVYPYRSYGDEMQSQPRSRTLEPEFCLITHNKGHIALGMPYRTQWSYIPAHLTLSGNVSNSEERVSSTCMVYRDNAMHRVDILKNGEISVANILKELSSNLPSCTLIWQFYDELARRYRKKPLVFPGKLLMDLLNNSDPEGKMNGFKTIGSHIVHCIGGEYLVVCIEESLLFVYSLSSMNLGMVLSNYHEYPIKAVYSVMSLVFNGPKVKDASIMELDDVFLTLDTSGSMVLVQYSLLHDDIEEDLDYTAKIGQKEIYSDGDCSNDEGFEGEWQKIIDHYSSTATSRMGVNKMEASELLLKREIERVVVNMNNDRLFVLTYDRILVWSIGDGRFLRSLPYLEAYRQAVSLSSVSHREITREIKSMPTIADTLSSFLMTDWQGTSTAGTAEDTYREYLNCITPNDLLCLSIFQEKCFRKRVAASLHVSFLRMNFTADSDGVRKGRFRRRKGCSLSRTSSMCHMLPTFRVLKMARYNQRCSKKIRLLSSRSICYKHKCMNDARKGATFSQVASVLIFPMQDVLCNFKGLGASLLPMLHRSGNTCYLGIPPGTFSIPLTRVGPQYDSTMEGMFGSCPPNDLGFPLSARLDAYLMRNTRPHLSNKDLKVGGAERICVNRYFSTCMLLLDLAVGEGPDEVNNWKRYADIWLLGNILVSSRTDEVFSKLYSSFIAVISEMSLSALSVHVCRALALLRCHDLPPNGNTTTFPQIRVCHCNGRTFTFGKRCGFCLKLSDELNVVYAPHHGFPMGWEEEVALMLLVVVVLDKKWSECFNFVIVGFKRYSFASYVAKQMFRQILSSEYVREDKGESSNQNCTFNPRTFYLEMFAHGFGVTWTLKSIDAFGIDVPSFRRSKINQLAKPFYELAHGSKLPSAHFIINAISVYRSSKSDHWFQILTHCFSLDPELVIQIMRWIVQERKLDKWYTETTIKLILQFTKLHVDLAVEYLPEIVVIIVRCLDPANSSMRLLMLKPATSAVVYLVKSFPMVAFYQNTQRLAVGSTSGHVVIYDLRTATKCKVLGGIMKNVSSIAFSATGDYIAAYYKDEPCLVVWNCSSLGFLGGLLNSSKKEEKVVKLKSVEPNVSTSLMVRRCLQCGYI